MDIASNKRTTNFKSLDTIYDAQFLMRYHTVPIQGLRQTVGAHSYAVAILIDQLWDSVPKQLIMAALYHDVPEMVLGDIPATAKWDYPEVKRAFEKAEAKVMEDLGLTFMLSPKDKARLKMADMLELVLYCEKHADANTQMKIIMNTGVQYLFSNFSDLKDFDPVKEVLRNRNLSN